MDEGRDRHDAVMCLAPAKINLALHVTGRRVDGYHELDTLAVFADCGERIAASPADRLTLAVAGPFAADAPAGRANLVVKAAQALLTAAGVKAGAAIRLEKHLPAGAGLGGGSADAAATLRALNRLFRAGFDEPKLAALGAELGADIAMCVHARALRARGIGEVIEPLSNIPPLPLVLVWPAKPVATASVFKRLKNVINAPLPGLPDKLATSEAVVAYLAKTRNDLQPVAIEVEPVIGDALDAIAATDQCLLARMSGSGSACFGIYPDMAAANAARQAICATHRQWWIRAVSAC